MRKRTFTAGSDVRIAQAAERDHGVLATSELLACGLTYAGIHRRSKAGRLHRLHHGVYAVGHASVSHSGRWLAAVKACGTGAVLSHQSATELLELTPQRPGPIHVTVPADRCPRSNARIVVHRSKTLTSRDTARRDRIPVTTPSRTLRDLKRVLPREQWEAAVDRARSRGIDTSAVVAEAPTRSVLERRFIQLCRHRRIPAPRVNVRVGYFLVDFLWPDHRLIAEVDGYAFHGGRAPFEADRARDAELMAQGYQVLRFTYRQVTEAPGVVAVRLRKLLSN
jgi:very-short-patch-repair endonuclease